MAARRNQERIKSLLLLAIPDEYLLKFHNVPAAKSLWAAIKSRFGGNEESKKMQKNVLKHQFKNFVTSSNETLDKAYNRFQKLISQLEIYGAYVSKEDINQKFLRSLPPSWSQIALIMRNKPDIDEVDIDDLYNNLRVYEDELKRSSGSNSASQNLAFLSSENTNSTNEVSTASGDIGVSTAGGINQVPSTPSAHDIAYSFLAQPTTSPQLENEDFQQMDGDDLEELDLRWQVAMLTVRGRNNVPTNESSSQALVAQDGLGGYDWSNDFEVEPVNYALMAISSSDHPSSSDCVAVKEREELKVKIAKWEESTKNLEEILKSQMSARDKTCLGYITQLNELSSNHETDSENSLSIFDGRSSDDEHIPENDRFSKNGYKAVPPPITGNFLTPRADISFAGLDEYAIRNKIIESQTTKLNNKTDETAGKTNDANTEKPKTGFVSNARPVSTVRPSVSNARPSQDLKQLFKTFGVKNMTTAGKRAVVNTGKGKLNTDLKKSRWVWRPKGNYLDHVSKDSGSFMLKKGNPEIFLQDHAVVDSGCSSHMTGNKAYLSDYEDYNGGFVAFGSDPKGDKLNFKLLDESQVVLRAPRKDDVYSLDLKNIVPSGGSSGIDYRTYLGIHYCFPLNLIGQRIP
ncbi:hypothetical protein Tco_0971710 [Tanacetum coccineum]